MRHSRPKWIVLILMGFLLVVMTGLVIPLAIYDAERPDGAIAETGKFIGGTARSIKNAVRGRAGYGTASRTRFGTGL